MLCTRCRLDQDLEAFARNKAKASGVNAWCRSCMAEYAKQRKPSRRSQGWVPKSHTMTAAERKQEWRKANPDKNKAARQRHYENQKPRYHAAVAQRRAQQHLAVPPWADLAKIRAIYAEAKQRNDAGEQVHVDHIVPLKHPRVSGLHVEANLAIIPALDNWSKNNRHWPDMP